MNEGITSLAGQCQDVKEGRDQNETNANEANANVRVHVPAIPMMPTVSRIFAIALGVKEPFVPSKKVSNAFAASSSLENSNLPWLKKEKTS